MKIAVDKSSLEEKRISMAVMSSFMVLTIQYLILVYFKIIGTAAGDILQLFSKAIVGAFYLFALTVVMKRNFISFFIAYFVSIFIFISNLIFYNDNWIYLKEMIIPFFFMCLPSFIYSYSINERDIFIEVMNKISAIVFVVGLAVGVLVISGGVYVGAYSMSLSYYMLLPAIIYLNNFFKKRNMKFLIIFFLSMSVILSLGARGPFICIVVYIILFLITNKPKLNYNSMFLYIVLILAIIFAYLKFSSIIVNLQLVLNYFGIKSRTLMLILQKELFTSQSRLREYSTVIELIKDNPLMGIGIGGDRKYTGMYTHNIFLELFSGFGILLGFFLILLVIYAIYISIKQNDRDNNILIIWLSIGFIPLLFSGSYITALNFWIFLGVSFKSRIGRKYKKMGTSLF